MEWGRGGSGCADLARATRLRDAGVAVVGEAAAGRGRLRKPAAGQGPADFMHFHEACDPSLRVDATLQELRGLNDVCQMIA
jgi:hypothetical protein